MSEDTWDEIREARDKGFAAGIATQAPTYTRTWVVKIPRRARQAQNAVGQILSPKNRDRRRDHRPMNN